MHRISRPLGLVVSVVLAGLAVGAGRPAAAPAQEPRKPDVAAADPLPRLRTIARMMVNIESRHRIQAAELERIARVCDEQKLPDLLRPAIRARHLEQQDYEARMASFAEDLGPELYSRMRAAMDAGPGQAPALRAIIPDPPPPPEPLPDEVEAMKEAKRSSIREKNGEEDGGKGVEEDG